MMNYLETKLYSINWGPKMAMGAMWLTTASLLTGLVAQVARRPYDIELSAAAVTGLLLVLVVLRRK